MFYDRLAITYMANDRYYIEAERMVEPSMYVKIMVECGTKVAHLIDIDGILG